MTLRLTLALAVAAAASAAAAQPAGPPPRPGEPPGAETKARHEALQKQHLEDLRTVLRLRPDQEPALAAFVTSHAPKRSEFRLPEPGATTPQRLEAMSRHEAEMRGQHEQMRQALSKFYAALSPEQQKVFDALERLKGPGGPGGPGPMILRRGPPGGPPDGPPEPPR